ncbi:MFS transporter [Lysinibacillus sphaericus]|uniref:MFS transporter n=2 Tax=Lysinibacillus TaxID=400634 RepID=A0A2S0K1R8_LYSSH|nr:MULTISPECIES: MFS transporter [Lysinibacillus]AVK97291.1 MFS transporter [Lysinibacillus sphaericus]MED4542595.1 MFS transporter [Lysinibacillus sphaericus]TKI20021.1 MFS transporter [Lysinibacillus sphaericus]TKI47665.1 MFS transporter [Lysinibacillus tabacifolii]SUV16815.1 major facilitator transporter [Lysinibacillus sphaericus]
MSEAAKYKKATYHLWTFTASKMIAMLGSHVLSFGISLYILAMTGSATSFATNMICSILPRALVAPLAGYVADNYSKKRTILIAQAGTILTMASLLFYTETIGMSVNAIYVTTVFYTLCSAFSSVTFTSAIATLVNPERLQRAMSFNQMSVSVAAVGGPVIGGMMYGFFSMEVFLIVHMVAYAIAFCLEATMNFNLYSTRGDTAKAEKIWQGLVGGFSYIKQHKVIKVVMWLSLWINLFFSAIVVGGTYIIIELLKVESTHFGFIEAAGAGGMLVASIYFASRAEIKVPLRFSKISLLLLSNSLSFAVIPLVTNLSYAMIVIFYIGLYFIFAIFEMGVNMPLGVFMQKLISEEYRGRVFGLMETMAMSMMPIGMLVYGVLYDSLPATGILLVTSIIIVVMTLVLLRRSVLKEAHPEFYDDKTLAKNSKLIPNR